MSLLQGCDCFKSTSNMDVIVKGSGFNKGVAYIAVI